MVNEIIIQILDKASLFLDDNNIHKLNNVLIEVLHNVNITKQSTELVPITDTYSKIKMFLACKKLEGLSPKSIKNYADTLYKFFNAVQKDYKHMTDMDLRMYLAVKSNQGNKNVSLNNQMSPVRSFFDWLYKQDYIAKDPMKTVKTIKVEKLIRKALNKRELEMLRDSCKTIRDKAMVEFFYSTASRLDEIQKLSKSQINWDNKSLIVYGKGAKEREVYLNEKSIYYLQKYFESRTDDEDAIFVSERSPHKRLGRRAIEARFSKLGKCANIKKPVFPHLLRHSFSSHALDAGMPITVVQEILGHNDLKSTQIYARMNKDIVQQTHRRLMQ